MYEQFNRDNYDPFNLGDLLRRANGKLLRGRQATRKLKNYLKHSCVICGETHQLEFHHLKKRADVGGRRMASIKNIAAVLEEAEKCVVVCRACHVWLHQNEEPIKYDEWGR